MKYSLNVWLDSEKLSGVCVRVVSIFSLRQFHTFPTDEVLCMLCMVPRTLYLLGKHSDNCFINISTALGISLLTSYKFCFLFFVFPDFSFF